MIPVNVALVIFFPTVCLVTYLCMRISSLNKQWSVQADKFETLSLDYDRLHSKWSRERDENEGRYRYIEQLKKDLVDLNSRLESALEENDELKQNTLLFRIYKLFN